MNADPERQRAQARVVQLLRENLADLQIKRSGYSIRRFARKLGIASPVLTQVLNGKRKVTFKFAKKVLPSLSVDTETLEKILVSLERPVRRARTPLRRNPSAPPHILSAAEFAVISDWWAFGILSLMDTEDFRSDEAWIAERLQLARTAVRKSLAHLETLGLIDRSSVPWKTTGKALSTTHDLVDLSIRKNHHQGIELAREALNSVAIAFRDFNAFTIAFDPSRMQEAKEAIDRFMKHFAAEFDVPPRKEVFRIQTQFFPLSREPPLRKEKT